MVAPMNTTFPILNFSAPLAYLSPDAGSRLMSTSYMRTGSLGAFIWDILTNIPSDYILLFKHKLSVPSLIYVLSRLSVLVTIAIDTIIRVTPLGVQKCQDVTIAACVLYHVSISSTSFLFFLRVRAVFNRDKYVIAFFTLLWLGVVGGSLTVAFADVAKVIGPTEYCSSGPVKPYVAASPITVLANDTSVFLAITWRLLISSWSPPDKESSPSNSVIRFVLGRNLPVFTRALVQDGQVYYLISFAANVLSVAVTVTHGLPLGFSHVYVFNAVIVNMMASRVFRRTKLGKFREDEISTTSLVAQLRPRGMNIDSDANPATSGKEEKKAKGEQQKRVWYKNLRAKVLLVVIVSGLVVIPIVCISICTTKKRKHNMQAM